MSTPGVSNVFGGVAKLRIASYPTSNTEEHMQIGGMEVPYNPNSVELGHTLEYNQNTYFNEASQSMRFHRARPSSLKLELLFDGTLPGSETAVDQQIDTLRAICMIVDRSTHVSRYLKVMWGQMQWGGKNYFVGRATAMAVRYTLFDRNGTPLRASVNLTIDADASMTENDDAKRKLDKVAMLAVPSASLPDLLYKSALAGVAMAGTLVMGGVLVDYVGTAYDNGMDALDDFALGDLLYVPWK